jgi:3-deoxy-D-manno-octulosonic-acid transferase
MSAPGSPPPEATRPPKRPPLWYGAAWLLVLPVAAAYLLWRSLRQPDYRRHWGERFLGRGEAVPAGVPVFWIHAVSVGETRAAQPLLALLARTHPGAHFVLTHMTPTGRATGAELARADPQRLQQRYLPYDLPFAVRRFLREVRPSVAVIMETEIWPQLLAQAHAARVPVVLANARLSQRSLDKALRQRSLLRAAAACIRVVGAQTPGDRERIARLFDGPVRVTGNIKFDLEPDAGQIARGRRLRARFAPPPAPGGAGRALWLFASTREGEERLLLDALRARGVLDGGAGAPRLLFVPRHPQRFDEVARLLRDAGATVLRRAQWPQDDRPAEVPDASAAPTILLGDSMGEMPLYYAMADAALIGGSLLPLGGQNLIEACACGCPVVLGPHMFNFAQAADDAVAAGAARRAPDAAAALEALAQVTAPQGPRSEMAQAALAFAAAHRGAAARTLALVEEAYAARAGG